MVVPGNGPMSSGWLINLVINDIIAITNGADDSTSERRDSQGSMECLTTTTTTTTTTTATATTTTTIKS